MSTRTRTALKGLFLAMIVAAAFAAGATFGRWMTVREAASSEHRVVRTVDGDTLVVAVEGRQEKVRLIGVDTPESVDPRRPVECFGREAARRTAELTDGKRVRLERDTAAGDRDSFGRLLRYVYLEDGTLLNELLIRDGYAHEYTHRRPYEFRQRFKDAERDARQAGRGLWAPNACR